MVTRKAAAQLLEAVTSSSHISGCLALTQHIDIQSSENIFQLLQNNYRSNEHIPLKQC